MKILAVGDPHGHEDVFKIPVTDDIDAVFITGDLGKSDLIRKYYFKYIVEQKKPSCKDQLTKKQLEELYKEIIDSSYEVVKYFAEKKPTFFVFGNIYQVKKDFVEDEMKKQGISVEQFDDKIKHLKNLHNIGYKTKKFKGLTIAGIEYFETMEWIKEFGQETEKNISIAKKEEPPARNFISKLEKVDILLTHLPPRGILDVVKSEHVPKEWIGKHAGDSGILEYVKKYQPKLVLCGHIHEARGKKKVGKTTVYNLGCNGQYKIIDV